MLRAGEDDAAAADDGKEAGELRAHVVVGNYGVVQHCAVATARPLAIGKQKHADAVPPRVIVRHHDVLEWRTSIPSALSQARFLRHDGVCSKPNRRHKCLRPGCR